MMAAEAEVKVDLLKTETRAERRTDRDTIVRTDVDGNREHKIHASDKASGIIGMEVRNRQNEKLGEIKDLVLDLRSGKVSYAVLAVGGFLGLGEKLIALPSGALEITSERGHLLLDADKARIQAAPGFAATAWPVWGDPQIEQFWKETSSGGAAESEIHEGSGKLKVDADVDRDKAKLKGEIKTDRSRDKIYTDADKDKKVEIEVK